MKSYMKNFKNKDFKRGGFGGNRGGRDERPQRGDDKPVFFGKSRGGDRSTDREQRMFKAVCSDCKKTCEVPFKPSSDKPVFCRDCFSAKRDRETKEYKAGLANGEVKKFGQDKPVHSGSVHSAFVPVEAGESTKKQLAEMNTRIDKLTAMVEKMVAEKGVAQVTKTIVSTPVKKITPKAVAPKKVIAKAVVKKVVAKKVTPKVVAKKVAVKKVAAKKVTPVKKVVAKKK
jgi:CxxC-x17-CxxC domain-containing protein